MVSVQVRALGGSCPSWASVADPWNWIVSPTFQVNADVGEETVGVGGWLPTLMIRVAVPVPPAVRPVMRDGFDA